MDKESINLLEFIKDNPLCKSGEMDGFALRDLKDFGYINAVDITTGENNGIPEFIEISITLSGKAKISEYNKENTKSIFKPKDSQNNALIKIAIGVTTGVLVIICGILISKYLGVS